MANFEVTLVDYLLLGAFGPFRIGDTRTDVRNAFGTPEDWTAEQKKIQANNWKYGSLQIFFRDERISLIGVYFRSVPLVLPEQVSSIGYFPTHNTTTSEFKSALEGLGLDYAVHPELTSGDQYTIRVGNSSVVIFDANTQQLDSIQCT